MSSYKMRCGHCGRMSDDTRVCGGRSQGNYRQAGRHIQRRVCRECTEYRIERCRREQEERNVPLDTSQFTWSTAARAFGIDIDDLYLSSPSYRRNDDGSVTRRAYYGDGLREETYTP
jgi:hypothetical protein